MSKVTFSSYDSALKALEMAPGMVMSVPALARFSGLDESSVMDLAKTYNWVTYSIGGYTHVKIRGN